jgi:hypothetical protein
MKEDVKVKQLPKGLAGEKSNKGVEDKNKNLAGTNIDPSTLRFLDVNTLNAIQDFIVKSNEAAFNIFFIIENIKNNNKVRSANESKDNKDAK